MGRNSFEKKSPLTEIVSKMTFLGVCSSMLKILIQVLKLKKWSIYKSSITFLLFVYLDNTVPCGMIYGLSEMKYSLIANFILHFNLCAYITVNNIYSCVSTGAAFEVQSITQQSVL